ncbi:hypothetical protein IKL64_02205 [bacterium]|nr:hypothetical protein [bacterium]
MNNFDNIEDLKKNFNWGAFLLGWIWGLFNNSYVTLIQIPVIFIPHIGPWIGFGLAVFFGIKGNAWALEHKQFKSDINFLKYQKILTCIGILVQMTCIVFVKILFEFSALHPPGYDFSVTTKIIKTSLIILTIVYIVVSIFMIKIVKQK